MNQDLVAIRSPFQKALIRYTLTEGDTKARFQELIQQFAVRPVEIRKAYEVSEPGSDLEKRMERILLDNSRSPQQWAANLKYARVNSQLRFTSIEHLLDNSKKTDWYHLLDDMREEKSSPFLRKAEDTRKLFENGARFFLKYGKSFQDFKHAYLFAEAAGCHSLASEALDRLRLLAKSNVDRVQLEEFEHRLEHQQEGDHAGL